MQKLFAFLRHGGVPISRAGPFGHRCRLCWNWLEKQDRYLGYNESFYDGPIPEFGFWYFHFYTLWY